MKLPDIILTVNIIKIYCIILSLVELSAICPKHLKMNHLIFAPAVYRMP